MIWIAMIVIAVLVGIVGGAAYYQSGGDLVGGIIFCGALGAAIVFIVEVIIALSFGFI